ncbi:unnamed protein product [Ascophyllum nodosum]
MGQKLLPMGVPEDEDPIRIAPTRASSFDRSFESDGENGDERTGVPGSTGRSKEEHLRRVALRNLTIMLTCTCCMMALYGYDFGITAWNVLSIKSKGYEKLTAVYYYLAYHTEVLALLVACVPIGGAIGGIVGSKVCLSNRFGRKAEMRMVNILCMTGAALEVLSGVNYWVSAGYVVVYATGRIIYGIGLGLSLRCGPMYLKETVTASFKDAATVSVKLSMVVGMITSYIVGAVIDTTVFGYGGAIGIAIVSLICLEFLPESPQYMLLHEEKYSQAQVINAVRFTNPSAEKAEVYALQEGIKNEILSYTPGDPSYCYCSNVDGKPDSETPQNGSSGGAGDGMSRSDESDTSDRRERAEQATDVPAVIGTREGYESLEDTQKQVSLAQSVKNLPSLTKAPGMRAAIVLTAGLMIFEQASGMIAILYYGGVFLADIDIIAIDWGLALLGGLQLVVAVVVMYTINPIGRKPLLLYGLAGLFLSASCLSVGGALGLSGDGRWWGLVGLYAFTAFYSISLGALVWVLVSDVFPTCHRAQAISIVCMAHFTTSATVIVLIPVMQNVGGYTAMFVCFTVVTFFANIFAHRFMVETKGLSLLEVQRALTLKAGFAFGYEPQTATV